jgi:hypothetical protein
MSTPMNFSIPDDLKKYLADLDAFIESTILPLQHKDDNNRFSTTVANTHVQTGTPAACHAKNGRICCLSRAGSRTKQVSTACLCQSSMAGKTARMAAGATCGWP